MPQAMSVHRRTKAMMTARPVKVSPQMKRSRQMSDQSHDDEGGSEDDNSD